MSEILSRELLDKIEENSVAIDRAVKEIIDPYCSELDNYVYFVRNILRDDEKPPTDLELDDFALNLSTMIYFTSVGAEHIGIRDDLSKAQYREAYNNARASLKSGTVADKNTEAESQTIEEHIISVVYTKAYKILKAKVESAQEMLQSVKKVISRRMSESELSRVQINN